MAMSNNSMIFDLETLGTDAFNCPVLSGAAFAFDTTRFISKPYSMDEIISNSTYIKVNVNEQCTKLGREIEKDTLTWWKQQDKEVQKAQMIPNKDDKPVAALIKMLYNTYIDNSTVYTRGNTFDPVIISSLCKQLNIEEPYPWHKVRDTRSLIEGLSWGCNIQNTFIPEGINKDDLAVHDPRVDIALDIIRIQSLVIAIS
tara:strand:+ start:193 stop:792 length:600 start_codon:yes stop_codon:yes gene_type:complete